MKRHERPYSCTFTACLKAFGSRHDWQRHETTQHDLFDTWCCGKATSTCDLRARSCPHSHLHTWTSFWCGFCVKDVQMIDKNHHKRVGRFDHIEDHFVGRNGRNPQKICDWVSHVEYEPEKKSQRTSNPTTVSPFANNNAQKSISERNLGHFQSIPPGIQIGSGSLAVTYQDATHDIEMGNNAAYSSRSGIYACPCLDCFLRFDTVAELQSHQARCPSSSL
jgi:hypothetical protein